jgi:hypothetical protein
MDHLGVTFVLVVAAVWVVLGLAASLIFGAVAKHNDEIDLEGIEAPIADWHREHSQRVARANFRYACRYGRRP